MTPVYSPFVEHNAILGGTNMTDVFWTGKLWHFDDISNIEKKNAPLTQAVDSGVCDAVYLNENRFIIVGDSGFVQMFEILPTDLDDVPAQLQSLSYTREHDSTALAVSLFPNKKDIVTAGMDYWYGDYYKIKRQMEN